MSEAKCVTKFMKNCALVNVIDVSRRAIDPSKVHRRLTGVDLEVLFPHIRPRTGVLIEGDTNLPG